MAFDHHSRAFVDSWADTFAKLRSQCPVAHSPLHGGFYVVTRYADIQRAARDSAVFSTENDLDGTGNGGRGIQIPQNPVRMGMLEMDPPANLDYRRLLLAAFSPSAARSFEPRVRELVGQCIDAIVEHGECDIVRDLGNPVPALVTLGYVGIPLDRAPRYGDILHRSVCTLRESAAFATVLEDIRWMIGDLAGIVAARHAAPQDDLISTLCRSEVNGTPMSVEAVTEVLFMILNGGVDTTTGVIASALMWLSQHPEQARLLREDTTRIPDAVEEFLRVMPPALASGRNVVSDVELSGTQLSQGDRVLLAWASANRDDSWFADPDEVLLDRAPNAHLSFGYGAHKCIGAALARVELHVVLEEVLTRLPELRIDPARAERYTDIGVINAFSRMPATLGPGRRSDPSLDGLENDR